MRHFLLGCRHLVLTYDIIPLSDTIERSVVNDAAIVENESSDDSFAAMAASLTTNPATMPFYGPKPLHMTSGRSLRGRVQKHAEAPGASMTNESRRIIPWWFSPPTLPERGPLREASPL